MRIIFNRARRARRLRFGLLLGTFALTDTSLTNVAHADRFFTKAKAQRAAVDYVASHYTATYASDLQAYCLPAGGDYDPSYKYRTWTCAWYDVSDETAGVVRIVGRRGRDYYTGRVIRAAHAAGDSHAPGTRP
jgi:hypothetical protein